MHRRKQRIGKRKPSMATSSKYLSRICRPVRGNGTIFSFKYIPMSQAPPSLPTFLYDVKYAWFNFISITSSVKVLSLYMSHFKRRNTQIDNICLLVTEVRNIKNFFIILRFLFFLQVFTQKLSNINVWVWRTENRKLFIKQKSFCNTCAFLNDRLNDPL